MICYFHLSKFPIESLVSGLEPEQEVSSNGEDMAAENQFGPSPESHPCLHDYVNLSNAGGWLLIPEDKGGLDIWV